MEQKFTISVDWENPAGTWWDAARRDTTAPPAVRPLLEVGGPEEIEVGPAAAAAIRAWASRLPGWADGPAYARYPLRIQDAGEGVNNEIAH